MPAGWQTERDPSSDDTEFKPVPFTALPATSSTSASTFMNSILLPLHLRPRYKLALAAQSAAGALRASRPCASPAGAANFLRTLARARHHHTDVPKVEEFRAWVTEQWYPRQQLPIIPCLPYQSLSGYEGEGQGSNRGGRRQLQARSEPPAPSIFSTAATHTHTHQLLTRLLA
jgi:hypothetical protein